MIVQLDEPIADLMMDYNQTVRYIITSVNRLIYWFKQILTCFQ